MSGLHRVVFDTSTLVSAALRVGSTPHKALALALMQGEVCVSESTLTELEQVLLRSKFDRYQTVKVRAEFVALVHKHAGKKWGQISISAIEVPWALCSACCRQRAARRYWTN